MFDQFARFLMSGKSNKEVHKEFISFQSASKQTLALPGKVGA
jgi:hypothetical protein